METESQFFKRRQSGLTPEAPTSGRAFVSARPHSIVGEPVVVE